MNRQTRTLRYKPYNEADAENWSWIVWGLNGDVQSDWRQAAKRVSTLLLNMKELDAIRQNLASRRSEPSDFANTGEYSWPHVAFQKREIEALNIRGRNLAVEVNKQLRFYKWSPGINTPQFEEKFRDKPQWNVRTEAEYQENVAIMCLLDELREERIDRFRVCRQCRRWFYAVAAHQVSCAESCRKKFAATADEFKAKRRAYMKTYRKQELAKNRKSKIQVKTYNKGG
jgi:hypothetical protein